MPRKKIPEKSTTEYVEELAQAVDLSPEAMMASAEAVQAVDLSPEAMMASAEAARSPQYRGF